MIDPTQILQEEEYDFPYHYLTRMPDKRFAQHMVDRWGINYISTIEFLLKEINICNPMSIVDIGCGDGRFTRELRNHFTEASVLGIDYSSRAIKLANAMNDGIKRLEYKEVDIIEKTLSTEFDVAVLMEVYEHIHPDKCKKFLEGVASLLKKDGYLFLTVPHINKPVEYKHFQHFSINSLTDQLSDFFEIVEVRPFEMKGVFRRVLNFILCNRYFTLNHQGMTDRLYRLHRDKLFVCQSESECQRIYVKARRKNYDFSHNSN